MARWDNDPEIIHGGGYEELMAFLAEHPDAVIDSVRPVTVDPVTGEERDASFPWMDDFDEDEYDDFDSPVDQAIVCLNVGDFDQAVYHLKEAAWAGNANAQFNLGLCYAKGCGVKRDFTKAAEWMQKAAENGDLDAVPLAETFCQTDMILKRAKTGDAAAQAELAGIYFDLSGSLYQYGPEADNREAYFWAKKAADQNDPDGLYRLGQCYQYGRGVQTDRDAAVRCFTRGANLGHAGCQRDLGVWYLEGTGVPQDEKKGFQLSLKAAIQGDNQAMFNVGMCYQLGRGVGHSLKRALDWYEASQAAYPKPELARRVQLLKAMPDLEKEESRTGLPPGHRDALTAAWKSIREKSLTRAGLSSREVCLSALRNVLNSPVQRLSTVLGANLSGLVRVLQAIAEQAERKEQEAHKRKDEERRKVEETRKKAEEEKRQPDGQGSNRETVTKAVSSALRSEDGLDRSLTVFTDGATVEAFMAKALSGQKEPEPKPQDYGGYKGFVMTVDYLDQALTAVLTVTERKVKLEHFVRDERRSNAEREYHGEWTKRNGQLQIDQDVVQRDQRVLYILVFHEMRKYLRRLGLLDQLKTEDNGSAGVMLTGTGGRFTAKLVKGKDRPELPCRTPHLGERLCRPYPDEQIQKQRDDSAEAARKAEEETKRKAEEARKKAEEEEKRKAEEARRKAEEEEKRKAEEARRKAEEEEKRKAEEARRKVEEEEKRKAEEARRKAEEEEKRKAEEARRKAEEEEKRKAEEARRKAEEEERRKAEEARKKAEEEEKQIRYESTVSTMEKADSSAAFRDVAEAFSVLSGYRDSDDLRQRCLQKAAELEKAAEQEKEYKTALESMARASSPAQYRMIADTFHSLREYRDAPALEQLCLTRSEELEREQAPEQMKAQSAENDTPTDHGNNDGAAKKPKRPGKGLLGILVAAAAVVILIAALAHHNNSAETQPLAEQDRESMEQTELEETSENSGNVSGGDQETEATANAGTGVPVGDIEIECPEVIQADGYTVAVRDIYVKNLNTDGSIYTGSDGNWMYITVELLSEDVKHTEDDSYLFLYFDMYDNEGHYVGQICPICAGPLKGIQPGKILNGDALLDAYNVSKISCAALSYQNNAAETPSPAVQDTEQSEQAVQTVTSGDGSIEIEYPSVIQADGYTVAVKDIYVKNLNTDGSIYTGSDGNWLYVTVELLSEDSPHAEYDSYLFLYFDMYDKEGHYAGQICPICAGPLKGVHPGKILNGDALLDAYDVVRISYAPY